MVSNSMLIRTVIIDEMTDSGGVPAFADIAGDAREAGTWYFAKPKTGTGAAQAITRDDLSS